MRSPIKFESFIAPKGEASIQKRAVPESQLSGNWREKTQEKNAIRRKTSPRRWNGNEFGGRGKCLGGTYKKVRKALG